MLLGRAMALLPIGEVATRENLLAALATALCAWLVYRVVGRLAKAGGGHGGEIEVAGGAAALLYLMIEGVFRQGTGVSGQAVAWAPTAVAVALAVRVATGQQGAGTTRAGLGMWLAIGLGLGAEIEVARLICVPLALLTAVRLRRGARWPRFAPFAFAVGLLMVFALPVLSARPPRWEVSRTFAALAASVVAPDSGVAGTAPGATGSNGMIRKIDGRRIGAAVVRTAAVLERQAGLPALLTAACGLIALALSRRKMAAALLAGVFGADVLCTILIDPAGPALFRGGLATAFVLAVSSGLGVAAFARLGAAAQAESSAASSVGTAAAVARALALSGIVLLPAVLGGGVRFARGGEAAAWARAALDEAPPRALVLLQGHSDLTAGIAYEQAVAGRRPDVTVLARDQLADAARVANAVARGGGMALGADEISSWRDRTERARRRDTAVLLDQLLSRSLGTRDLRWQPGAAEPPSGALLPGVPLFHLEATPAAAALPAARPLADKLESLLGSHPADARLRVLAASVSSDLAAAYLAAGDDARGAALAEAALLLEPDDAPASLVLADAISRRQPEAALHLIEQTLARDPDDLLSRLAAGRLRLRLGDPEGAERDFLHAQILAPASPDPLAGLARVAHARGDDPTARRLAGEALSLAPDSPSARALARDLGLE